MWVIYVILLEVWTLRIIRCIALAKVYIYVWNFFYIWTWTLFFLISPYTSDTLFAISLSQVLSGIRKKEMLSAFYGDITSHYHWAKNTTTHPPNKIHFENLGYFFSMCSSCLAKLFSLPEITWKVLHSFQAAGKFPSCEI